MAEAQWLLKEDGYINIDSDCSNIIYHPNLNIILVFSKHGYVDVLDVNSGVVLTRTSQLSEETEAIRGRYLPEQDRVLFWDGKNIGLRGDYNNVLLLDTILQTPIHQIYATVKVELLLSEAILIQQSLDNLEKHGLENTAEVMNELTLKINEAQQNAKKKGIKAQKWETICLELPHGNLKVAASGVVMHLKRLDCHIPALAIASAVNERLTDLFYGARLTDKQNPNTQRFHMFSEAARQQTFEQWPHMDYKWALPDQMAQAGFYYHPSKRGDDRAMCFTCNVCLVCWEKTDEPWSEHERHSADCPFVKGEYTQNVPLAITYATSPATATNGFTLVSNGDRGIIICTGTTSGEVIIWNVEKQLQNFHKFDVSNDKNAFLTKMSLASEDENSYDIRLSALCTFKTTNSHSLNNNNQSSNNYKKTLTMTLKSKIIGSKIFCGINMKNNVDDNVHGDGDNNNDALLLVVYGVEDNNTAQSTNDNSICSSNASNAKNNSLSTKESLTSLQTNKKSSLCTIEEKSEDDFQYLSIYHLFSDNLSTPSIMNKNPKWNEEKPFKKSSSGNMLTPTECVVSSLLHQGGPIISQDSNPYILGNSSSSMSDMSGTLSSASSLSTPNNEIQCNPIQMVTLNISKAHKNMEITEIIPSNDYKHILVIVKNQGITQMFVYNLNENGVIDEIPLCDKTYDDVNDSCPKEIIMLPKCDNNGRPFGGLDSEHGIFAMICNNGSLNIVSLTTLRTISEVAVDKHKFVSLTYCKNLERLCACTGNGSLHFYSFYDLDAESSDGREDENQYINMSDEVRERDSLNKIISEGNVETDSAGRNKQTYDDSKPSTSTSSSSAMPNLPAGSEIPTASGNSDIIAYKKSLSINDLKILYSLTLFDEMLTPYSAEVPVCWSKLVQAQKQRRQQHLQFSDDTHLTRTWRLHNDATTWDEHLIELSLPKMASLGHIDFKFNLYKPCNNPPAIQVTLLKQKSIGLCFRRKTQTTSSCVDDNIDFNISSNDTKDSVENPVLNDEYLQARNAEVIAGPIELSSCMDLSDQGGVVTLTGPKLLKTKGRNYLLHIKTMADLSKEGQGKTRVTVRKKGITSILLSSFSNTASQNSCSDRITFFQDSKDKSRKNDYYIGCDWLHEISITARSTRHVHKISNERLQRISILESNLLLENLLKILANNESYLHQNLSLDILIWIVTIRMSRYRSPSNKYRITTDRKTSISEIASSDVSVQQSECIEIIQKYLVDIIKNCILLNNRTIAHKCVKLLILSLDGAENMLYKKQYLDYEEAFMYAILINLPEVLNAEYSGSLRWFTILISGTSTIESQGLISEKCVQLLIDITSELAKRTNINNSLLSTRFGLYGLPFESEIFDTELPILVKNNPTFAYASILKSSYSNNSQGQQSSQLHSNKGFSTGSDQSEPKKLPFQLNIGNHFKGLLEVEPLHFICCEATEATRLENVESGNLQTTNMIDDILLDTPSQNNIETVHVSQNFGKKEPEKDGGSQEDMMNNVKNILVDKIFYSAIKKHKLQEKIKKLSIEDLDAVPSEMTTAIDTTTTPSDDGWATYEEPRVVYLTPNNFNDQNIDSILDGINTTSTTLTNKIHEFLDDTPEDMSTSFPWHKLLNTQPKQMIIVDRMHSGARRHITLDFGTPTLLTDIVFPACVDVACISIDVWCFTEEADSVRLVVSNDIGIKTLVLSDLQPPPICRFMKITFTGRYGMSATRCRIPIGLFYGHVIVLEKEGYADHVMKYIKNKKSNVAAQLKALNSLFEDVHCRYCLASSKLSDLLKPLLNGETSNIAHIQAYLNKSKDSNENSPENSKIVSVYEECISFQNQLNIIQRVIKRLEQSNVTKTVKNDKITNLADIYTDKLRFLSDCMIEMLLHFIITYGSANINEINSLFDLKTCNQLFDTLVIAGDTQIQLATCSLLVKMCCFQPWWGDFFADIFTKLYSSQNSRIFPQDRVFFFLTYLGRKSISMGTCRSIVIDAILKSIAGLLVPLSQTYNQGLSLWSTTDLNLLGWLLLFLSVCLDGIDKKDQSQSKWDFMSGEADMVKSRLSLGNNSLRTLTRSLKKRFSQKQHFNSNVAEKFFMMSSDQMSQNAQLEIAIKQHENQLKKIHNTKLFGDYLNDMVKTKMIIIKPNENAVNTNVLNSPGCPNYLLIKKKNNANYNNSNNINSSDTSNMNGIGNNINTSSSNIGNNMNSSNSSNNSSSQSSSQQTIKVPPYTRKTEDSGSNDTAFDKGLKSLNSDNILVVVRGLIGLILNMDFTCNMDLFLLTCKIIARLVLASHPSNSLSKLMTTTQLLQLVRIAVWENQQQPWAVHAITCLLQDILAADKRVNNSGSNNNINNIVEIDADGEIIETDDMGSDLSNFKLIISPQVTKDMSYAEAVKFQLPSLLECEDAEMEDLLDDFLERDKKGLKKDNVSMRNGITTILYRTISSAMDARLEYGLDTNIEITLRRLTMKSSLNLCATLPQIAMSETIHASFDLEPWPENIVQPWSGAEYDQDIRTNVMLTEIFDNIFTDLHMESSWLSLEKILELWLTLNVEAGDQVTRRSKIPFGEKAVCGLMKALATHPSINLRAWCLGFQCLIFACKPFIDHSDYDMPNENSSRNMDAYIVQNPFFPRMLNRFFSGADKANSTLDGNRYAGPSICKLIMELFVCLELKPHVKEKLKEILLQVVLHLIQYDGAISIQQGPIDAQSRLIKELLILQYEKTDLGVAMSIIESVSNLVYNNIANVEKVYCQKSSETNNSSNVFGSLFATVLGPESSRKCKTVTDSTLLVDLLKLSSILILTKIPRNDAENPNPSDSFNEHNLSNESQTDEIKAAEQHSNEPREKPLCFADTVLQHSPTMTRFFGSLSQCSNSLFAMLVATSMYTVAPSNETKNALGEPRNVSDALFQLLIYLSKTSTQPILVIKPLFEFISFATSMRHAMPKLQLSEPFSWFILEVLETPTSVKLFTEMGGIKVLCESLVRSNRCLINTQPSLVSMIMQRFISRSSTLQSSLPGTSSNKKTSTNPVKNDEGLINFAPYCTITSETGTAQPVDVLIQAPIASHRRARNPAWSYLFYPKEAHVDLKITLPTAVLLKEIQLQPHLSTLASCPSAIAIEITRDNNLGPIPITQPVSTVGMTCIRLRLSQPEIATSVIIRLYRPKDSSSIGLTQVLLLGTTTFNDSSNISSASSTNLVNRSILNTNIATQNNNSNNDNMANEDDTITKTSFGWLRILAQCFNVASYNNPNNTSNASSSNVQNIDNSQLLSEMIESAASVNGFLEACCALLNIGSARTNMALQNLETVLLKIGLHSVHLGLKLIDNLLKESIPQTFKMCNDSVSDLLYHLCTAQDSFTKTRIEEMLIWLRDLRNQFHSDDNLVQATNPYSGFVKCLSSILWQSYATNLILDLPNLITKQLFESLYNWLTILNADEPLKVAIDAMMCSICCIRPELFTVLLKKMEIFIPNLSTDLSACISDDRKDSDSNNSRMTDDIKQEESDLGEWYSHLVIQDLSKLSLTKSQLDTIALACQSPLAIQLLIDSGLPNLLTSAILEFCHRTNNNKIKSSNIDSPSSSSSCLTDSDKAENNNKLNSYPMVTIEKIKEILGFFTDICAEGHMRDWLGSYEGSIFWQPLLVLLCNNKFYNDDSHNSMITPQPYMELEESVIKFLSAVTSCHPKNQNNLSICLIAVIRKSDENLAGKMKAHPYSKASISSFTRRLVLQILLESEKIVVSVRSDLPLQKKESLNQQTYYVSNHPSKRPNSHYLLFYLSANSKCQEILENYVSVYSNIMPSITTENRNSAESSKTQSQSSILRETRKELLEMGMGIGMEFLSVAAGVTAKDKRLKEVKNQAATMKAKDLFTAFKLSMDDSKGLSSDSAQLTHSSCPDVVITSDTTIAQILAMLKYVGFPLSTPCINLNIVQGVKQQPGSMSAAAQLHNQSDHIDMDSSIKAADFLPLPSPLQIFSARGGLSLLAHYLPTVYPEASKSQQQNGDKDKTQPVSEWVKVEQNEEIYEDLDDMLVDSTPRVSTITSVPQHSLSACGLFLKLPAYSEVLIRDKVRAQCLLRLILGVTGDGEGNEIYSLALSSSLPTLPFEVFRQLLDSSPLTTDDGVLLRRKVIEIGAIHLILNCLGIFTHHSSYISSPQDQVSTSGAAAAPKASGSTAEDQPSDDKSHVYWAKGTGFGTGSTQQSWNVEQALLRQKSEEEHVTILLQVLSSYINPGDKVPVPIETGDDEEEELNYHETNETLPELPPIFLDFLQQSCLIPALCSYLSNDSVLDITRHIPLYRAILQLLRAISLSSQLITLLIATQNRDGKTSIASLLLSMKACVDTYASRLKINKKSNGKNNVPKMSAALDDSDDEGLALLIPDIQETAILVQNATTFLDASDKEDDDKISMDYPIKKSLEEKYLEVIKKLQFDSYDMIKETDSESGFRFTISHHFETNVRMAGERGHPQRVKRLAQEAVTLSTSLPLSYSSSVFVRYDTDRLDIMKVLITGPADTPYANGCFEFDIYFPTDYPNSPMMINLETTGKHSVRFNPNLYNDGKVCLSVLNTWHGRPEEKWNAQTSSFLQVLVSIQSLILVPEPYFNEPGFERSRGTPSGSHSSREYNSNIYQACVRWAMLEQLKNPCPCFKDVIHTHFWLKRNEICTQIEGWIAELSKPQQNERSGRTLSYNANVLRRQYRQLREELAKLPIPEGLEDFDNPFSANITTNAPSNSSTSTSAMPPSDSIPATVTAPPPPVSPQSPASPVLPATVEEQAVGDQPVNMEEGDKELADIKQAYSMQKNAENTCDLFHMAMMANGSIDLENDFEIYSTLFDTATNIASTTNTNNPSNEEEDIAMGDNSFATLTNSQLINMLENEDAEVEEDNNDNYLPM